MTKVNSITLHVNDRHLAKLTAENNSDLFLQSRYLEFLIDKIDSFGNFDFYESYPNKQYRISLLEAKVTLEIKFDIDAKNRKFEIKGRAKSIELLGDIEIFNDKMDTYKLRQAILDSINDPNSSFYYDIDGEVEFVEDDWMKEGIKDAL